jgi:hypothetical protein
MLIDCPCCGKQITLTVSPEGQVKATAHSTGIVPDRRHVTKSPVEIFAKLGESENQTGNPANDVLKTLLKQR